MKAPNPLPLFLLCIFFFNCTTENQHPQQEAVPLPQEDSLFEKANFLKDAFKTDSAIMLFNELEAVYRQSGNWEKAIACQRNTAFCYWISHRSERAEALCKQILPEAEQRLGSNHRELAAIFQVLGNIHADRRTETDFRLCLDYYGKAQQIHERFYPEDKMALAYAYDRFGIAHWLIADYAHAVPFYEKAEALLGEVSDENAGLFVKVTHNQGLLFEGLGLYSQALENFEQAYTVLEDFQKLRTTRTARLLENIARMQLQLGDFGQALLTYEKADALEKEVGQPNSKQRAFNLGGTGDCYFAMGDYVKARSYYEQCLPFWTTGLRDDLNGLQEELQNIGDCYLQEKKPAEALPYFQWAWAVIDTAYDAGSYKRLSPLVNLGRTHALTGNTRAALDLFQKALEIARNKVGDQHPSTGRVKALIAGLYFENKKLSLARQWADEALASYAKSREPNPPASAISDLPAGIDLVLLQGNIHLKSFEENENPEFLRQALHRYRYGLALTDSLKISLSSGASRQEVQKKVKALSEKGLDCTHLLWNLTKEDSLLETAFTFFEKSKSAQLVASLRETRAKEFAGFSAGMLAEEKRLQSQYAYYRQLVNDPPETALGFQEDIWKQQLFNAKRQLDSLVEKIEQNHPKYFRLKYDTGITSLQKTLEHVQKENAQLVEFFWGDSSLFLISIKPGSVRLRKIEGPDVIAGQILDLKNQLHHFRQNWEGDFNKEQLIAAFGQPANALYQSLLQPVLSGPSTKLILIPDGLLGYLPFPVLLDSRPVPGHGEWKTLPYLFRDYNIQHAASATVWLESPAPAGRASYAGFAPVYENGNLLAIATTRSDSLRVTRSWPEASRDGGLSPLLFNRQEVGETAQITRGKAFFGREATEALFKKTAANGPILHCAMHALTDDADPMNSSLVFTPFPDSVNEGMLHAWELYSMRLPSDLAVLSACNTGAGQLQKGEGVMSLSHAFQYAGCAAVLMSLWPANDAVTKDLTVGFFKNLKEGRTKSEALRQSRLQYLAGVKNDDLAHPAYWANFVLMGNDAPLDFNGSWWSKWWWVLVVVAVGAGFFCFYRARIR